MSLFVGASIAVGSLIIGYKLGSPKEVEKTEHHYVDTEKFRATGSVHSSGRLNIESVNTEDMDSNGSVHGYGTVNKVSDE